MDTLYDKIEGQIKESKALDINELYSYYDRNKDKLEIIRSVIDGKNYWTLREIEKTLLFNETTYLPYKQKIREYGKKNFDPFRRSKDIIDVYGVETTVGQLNFFKWIFEENILNLSIPSPYQSDEDVNIIQ